MSYDRSMGTWGPGTFENDHALDWWGDLREGSPSLARDALARVANAAPDADLDADDCCEALVAAEFVAAAVGRGIDRLPSEEAEAWLEEHGAALRFLELARSAVERIESRSELQELWDEGGRDEDWHGNVAELRSRLAGAS